MKVLLLQDNKNLGKKGDIVTVSDGFAFNNLIPQGIVKPATAEVLAQADRQREKDAQEQIVRMENMKKEAQKLNKKKVTITAQAKGSKLFGSVGAKDIADAINNQHGITVTEDMIDLRSPIKELTTQEVTVQYAKGVTASVVVTVSSS